MWSNAAAAAWIWHAGSLRVIRDSGWIRHHVQRVVLNWVLGVLVFVCIIFQAVWSERMNSICVVVFDRPVSTVQCFWGALCTSCWLFFRFCLYIDHLLVYILSHCTGQGCDLMPRQLPLACRLVSVYPGQRVDFAHVNWKLVGLLHRLVLLT